MEKSPALSVATLLQSLNSHPVLVFISADSPDFIVSYAFTPLKCLHST